MDINSLIGTINASWSKCAEPGCGETIDVWPPADSSAGENKVIYIARDGLFAGICSHGHSNEFYIGEVRQEVIAPHMRTERTLGRPVSQQDCIHSRTQPFQLEEGQGMPSDEGLIVGPAHGNVCVWCLKKLNVERTSATP